MSETPRVWNKRDPNVPADAVYVGRPSKWGNPYAIGEHCSRDAVIRRYRARVEAFDDTLRAEWLAPLRGKHLVCWCAPLPCHADVLLELANQEPAR